MIFLLIFILLINCYYAYNSFKDIASPPVLMGIGMLAASIVSLSYYAEWSMDKMLPETVLILGGAPLLFSFCCKRFYIKTFNFDNSFSLDINLFNTKRLVRFYAFFVIFAFVILYAKYQIMRSTFTGSFTFSELLFAARMDVYTGDDELDYPKYITYSSTLSLLVSFYTFWILSVLIIQKKQAINKLLILLLWFHFFSLVINGMLRGDKASMLDPVFRFISIFVYVYYMINKNFKIKKIILIRIALFFLILMLSFRGLSEFIGREVGNHENNFDMFAEYIGAQIKNFDIYKHGADGHEHTNVWGIWSFNTLYKQFDDNIKSPELQFQNYNGYSLGNVYTMFYHFDLDFGLIGVVVMTILISFVSMVIYNKLLASLTSDCKPNINLFIYSMISFPLFMSFFGPKFLTTVFSLSFIKLIIYIVLFSKLFNKYLIYKNEH